LSSGVSTIRVSLDFEFFDFRVEDGLKFTELDSYVPRDCTWWNINY